MFFSHTFFFSIQFSPMRQAVITPTITSYYITYSKILLPLLNSMQTDLTPFNSIKTGTCKELPREHRKTRKRRTMNQWVMLVSAKSLVNWALRKRGKGLWRFLKVRHAQTDTEVVLLHSCRETSLSHRGTEGLGNQAPLCLARTARLEECLAVEALCTHERTHWKDIRLRWEEEARGQKKKRKAGSLW